MFLPTCSTMKQKSKKLSKLVGKTESHRIYSTHVIINHGLYFFYPFLSVVNKSRVVNMTNNLCTKQGNLGLKFAVSNQERVIMVRIW